MKLTRKQAMDEKCFDCGYDSLDKGSRFVQIEACIDETCALWEYRPVTGALKEKRKQEAYDALSPEEKTKADEKSAKIGARLKASLNK